jgi:hypothetical protein
MGVVSEHHERRDELGCPEIDMAEPAVGFDRCHCGAPMVCAANMQSDVDRWNAWYDRHRHLLPPCAVEAADVLRAPF